MKKIVNAPENSVSEMMEGFLSAYAEYYEDCGIRGAVISKTRRKQGVALVIGGGSGHEPLFGGFVGDGLADAAVCGNLFAAPNPKAIFDTAMKVNNGAGVLFVYGNYAGDNMNFDIAEEMCEDMGIPTAHVRVNDDCASAPQERASDRRGIAGDVFVIKTAGAAIDAGMDLDAVKAVTERANANTRSIGIALYPGTVPGREPMFELGEDEIEYGMGLHGEQGVERTKIAPADTLVEYMYGQIQKDFAINAGEEVLALCNSLGSTTVLELGIAFRSLKNLLERDGIGLYSGELKNWCTSQDMAGFSITLTKLDDELKQLFNRPCFSPYYARQARK